MQEKLLDRFRALVDCYDLLLAEEGGKLTEEQRNLTRAMQRSAGRLPGMFEQCVNENDIRLILIYDCASPFAVQLQTAELFLEGMVGDIAEGQKKHFQRIEAISRELLEYRASLVVAHRQERQVTQEGDE
jgi:hypothetical protein